MATINVGVVGTGNGAQVPQQVDAVAGQSVQIADGFRLEGADFSRSGHDLTIASADGDSVVVRDFFAADPLPQLLFEAGEKHIAGDLAARLAGPEAPVDSNAKCDV